LRERREIRRLPAQQSAREPDRVDDRRLDTVAREPHRLVVEERHVEARVVRNEHRIAGEREKAARDGGDRRRAPQLVVPQPRQRGDARLQPRAGVCERLKALR